jgi:nucleoside-diphosphate-sugar epimerase
VKIFLTGRTGFVGQALARALAGRAELAGPAGRAGHDWLRPYDPRGERADLLVHAAFAGANRLADNELLARNAAQAARELHCARVLVISSGSVHAERDGAIPEDAAPDSATDYGRSCLRAEEAFRGCAPSVLAARLFYPYGAGQGRERLVPRLAGRILRGEPVALKSGGRPRINPVHADDLGEALARLALLPRWDAPAVHVAGPETASIRELAELIARALGKSCRFTEDPVTARDLVADTARLRAMAGFAPATGLAAGLQAALKGFSL